MTAESLRTVSQLADELPAFDEPAIRRLIFHAERLGLGHAIVRIGRKVFIDIDAFNRWLDDHRGVRIVPKVTNPRPSS